MIPGAFVSLPALPLTGAGKFGPGRASKAAAGTPVDLRARRGGAV